MRVLPTRWRRKPAGIEITSLSRYAYNVSPPVLREEQARRAYVLLLFFKNFLNTFSDFCQTNYLNIYVTDLHEICRLQDC